MIPPSLSVTMKDVAAELGVSVTTISKVLNNHADIGEATRQRVLAKVEELGYRRNARRAQSHRSAGRTPSASSSRT